MKFAAGFPPNYPQLTKFILANRQTLATKAAVWAAFKKYGEFTDDEARSAAITLGTSPTIDTRMMPGAYGEFSGGTFPDTVFLSTTMCKKFEALALKGGEAVMHKLIEAVLLHEMVHWGDWKDGKDQTGEEGDNFEIQAYGARVHFTI